MKFEDRLTCSIRDAREATSLGTTRLYELLNQGLVKSHRLDGRRLIDVKSLVEFINSQSTNQSTAKSRLPPKVGEGDRNCKEWNAPPEQGHGEGERRVVK